MNQMSETPVATIYAQLIQCREDLEACIRVYEAGRNDDHVWTFKIRDRQRWYVQKLTQYMNHSCHRTHKPAS